eukprot:gene8603-9478_t
MSELIENQDHFLEHQDIDAESENGTEKAVKVKIQEAHTEDTFLSDTISDDSYGELESEEEEVQEEVEFKEDVPAVPDAKDIPTPQNDDLHDLDVAINATMVEDDIQEEDGDHVTALSEKSPRRESIDDLREWIRKTSSKLKNKKSSFGLTNNGKAEDIDMATNSFRSPSQKSSSHDLATTTTTTAPPPTVEEDPTSPVVQKKAGSAGHLLPPPPPATEPAVTVAQTVAEPVLKTCSATGFITAYKPSWPYEVLVQRNIEKNFEGLVLASLEAFLSEEEFEKIFERSRVEFYKQPKWRQADQKKKAGLF